MTPILVVLPHSPWSDKARWALDHHRISYRAVDHVPLVFEPLLRLASRDVRQKPTVPILFAGSEVCRDSLAIVRYADRVGASEPLIPSMHEPEVLAWNERVERFQIAARARLMPRLIDSPPALIEELPKPMRALGGALVPIARLGARFVAGKFDTASRSPAEAEATMSQVLELAEVALARSSYLVADRFTLADVALACATTFVLPPVRAIHGAGAREVWQEPKLAAAFPSVLRWRDELLARHR